MDLDIRDWMIIIGILLIAAVLFDGYRRVRNERRNQIRMSLTSQAVGDEEPYNPELPGGGARVLNKRDPIDEAVDNDDLDLHQSVPVLMELDEVPGESGNASTQGAEQADSADPAPAASAEPEDAAPQPADDQRQASTAHQSPPRQLDVWEDGLDEADSGADPDAQEVLVIHAVSASEHGFKGPDLLQILLACDLRFGKMNIFHRHERPNGQGPTQFSVANMVEPGVFDLDKIEQFSTPGVTFFLTLPGPEKPVQAFDYMVETAQCLVKNLGAELQDETRSDINSQTIEHCRQRIRDFERRRLANHA